MQTPPLQLSVTCARSLPGRSRAESEFASSPNMQTGGCTPAAVLDGAPPGPSPARAPGKQQRPGSDSARRPSARRPRGTPTAPAPRPHAARTIPKASHLAVRRGPPTAALCIRPSVRLPAHSRIPPIAGSPALSITVGPAHRRAPHPANRAPRPPPSQSSNPRAPNPSRRRAPCSWTLRVRGATPPFLGQRGAGLAPRGLYRCVRGICVLPTAPSLGRSPDVPEPSGCVRCSRCPGSGAGGPWSPGSGRWEALRTAVVLPASTQHGRACPHRFPPPAPSSASRCGRPPERPRTHGIPERARALPTPPARSWTDPTAKWTGAVGDTEKPLLSTCQCPKFPAH